MRRSAAKEKLADMIEEAIDCQIEEIMAYCEKHRLSYEMDLKIWKWGEERDGGLAAKARKALEELGLALADEHHQWTPRQRKAWEKADLVLRDLT